MTPKSNKIKTELVFTTSRLLLKFNCIYTHIYTNTHACTHIHTHCHFINSIKSVTSLTQLNHRTEGKSERKTERETELLVQNINLVSPQHGEVLSVCSNPGHLFYTGFLCIPTLLFMERWSGEADELLPWQPMQNILHLMLSVNR